MVVEAGDAVGAGGLHAAAEGLRARQQSGSYTLSLSCPAQAPRRRAARRASLKGRESLDAELIRHPIAGEAEDDDAEALDGAFCAGAMR